MTDFDEIPALRAEIRRLNDVIEQLQRDNGDLGERLAVEIQKRTKLELERNEHGS